ncbi:MULTISPECIES: hypothetical protein [Moorena]|uniref:hypothetical protein n=1 Tax=Moorena TaxID=1155738 RepID=UPI00031E7EF1|nr:MULTISPECIES: hypothetical protein [Moorena]NEP67542.1 hypothetical protein [Moorena sp. SIO3A5]NEQ06694.1 hypothetical protein [Moorena sp. SIO4E2]
MATLRERFIAQRLQRSIASSTILDSRFPFPSWEGLGVGSYSLLPTPLAQT